MARAQDVREAEQQVKDEAWQCLTCSAPRQEGKKHCMHCEMYWDDVDNGMFDDDYSYGCDCSEPDYNIIEGTAKCWDCGRRWHVSSEEWRRLEKAQREYDEWDAQQQSEPPAQIRPLSDDEIPF